MKIGLIGGVSSSEETLKKLIEHGFEVVLVMGYEPVSSNQVSGYRSLRDLAPNATYIPFTRVNDHVNKINKIDLDLLFVVGISQLVSEAIIDLPRLGCIGFHPTKLPNGRGRAPLAWLNLTQQQGAANFFLITEIADAGPIFIQQPFEVNESDDTASIESKMLIAIRSALDTWLPKLKSGEWAPEVQDESQATRFGVRRSEDGKICWHETADQINRLIKSTAPPHPCAYTFLNDKKLYVLSSNVERSLKIKGVVGRILLKKNEKILVQCCDSLIWLNSINYDGETRVGQQLGYDFENEIFQLKKEIKHLKSLINGS